MFRRQAPLVLLLATLTFAGCGGSSHSSGTSTTSATTTTRSPTTGSGSTAAHAGSGSAGPSSSGGGAASAGGAGGGGASGGGSGAGGSGGGGGAINARVPATYHLVPPGRLTPPTISVPAFIAVQITIASADSQPHTVQVRTPAPHTLHVPAHGRAGVRLPGLRAGSYPITVDGSPRGTLSIGGEPGP